MHEMSLNMLQLNEKGLIKEIDCNKEIKRRLMDLGLIKNTYIIPVLVSPSKDPRAYLVRGTTIAIRKEEAEKIKIIKTN